MLRLTVPVSHMLWIAPGPSTSASVAVVPGSIVMQGLHFQPVPRSRELPSGCAGSRAPPATAPSGFSAEIDRVLASERRERLPSDIPKPLNGVIMMRLLC